ncbi:tRNA dihydrouridine synthase [Tieghemiomyces parasiticus]|uniref:tRNA-dihydrouridine(16/17) synthase [NAD(P)(+)] n=1 Tax=Tieghemiomyces parasiticus TaxID=78921 RepID=A0A9W8DJ35_9FUNG|nr:tRNA dihydrouridine synthase [Tieghemiomyces parasiticus]
MAACASTTAERSDQGVIDDVPASLTLVPSRKLGGFEFYEKVLKRSRYFLAPMVDQSELAWRILSRRYGAEVCYTPMIHARLFSETHNKTYFAEQWQTNATDRPLIAQFCANDPNFLLQAALRIQDQCDAVDLNLGCPQGIAQKGHYGSFLMEEWDLVARMVNNLHTHLDVPVTCKIRVFPEVERTVAYARMLEAAGCQLLTVHGRLREQRGHKTGLADWEKIRRVREAVSIPVVANGNILYPEDMEACIKQTGVVGVMSAEGNLYNPALFAGRYLPSYELAGEYMAICRETPTALAYIRAHLFKLFRPSLPLHTDLRDRLAKARTHEEMESMVQDLTTRLKAEAELAPPFNINLAPKDADGFYILPHWIAQPYIRPPFDPKTSTKKRPVPVPVPRPTGSTAVGPGPVTTATATPPAFVEPTPSSLVVTPTAGPSPETLAGKSYTPVIP